MTRTSSPIFVLALLSAGAASAADFSPEDSACVAPCEVRDAGAKPVVLAATPPAGAAVAPASAVKLTQAAPSRRAAARPDGARVELAAHR